MASWTVATILIVVLMITTGTLNTISAGFQQRADGQGKDWAKPGGGYIIGEIKTFDHPYLQAMGMMAGECLCMVAFVIMTRVFKKGLPTEKQIDANRNFSATILYPAALFDLIGTSLNYVGMILSYPSSFQMLRGSVIVFTAGLSIVFLKRWPKPYQWLGILIIIGGLCVVGAGDMIFQEENDDVICPETTVDGLVTAASGFNMSLFAATDAATTTTTTSSTTTTLCVEKKTKLGSNPLVGDIIIVTGEVFHALQFIYEEYYLGRYDLPPLKVVGYEGIFGFCTITVLLWPMYFIKVGETFGLGPEFRFEDAIDGLTQFGLGAGIMGWTFGNMFSIAMFNFAGVSVTKALNGTTRAVLDNIRQIFIWAFSLIVGWQTFNFMTPIGFVVLILGIWIYNDVIIRPLFYKLILKKPLPVYEDTVAVQEQKAETVEVE